MKEDVFSKTLKKFIDNFVAKYVQRPQISATVFFITSDTDKLIGIMKYAMIRNSCLHNGRPVQWAGIGQNYICYCRKWKPKADMFKEERL